MLAVQHPEDISGAYVPARSRQSYTSSQKRYQKDRHLRDSNLASVGDFLHLKSIHGSFTLQRNDHQSMRKIDVQRAQMSLMGSCASYPAVLGFLLQSPKKSTSTFSSISKQPGFNPKLKSSTQIPATSHQNSEMDQPTAGKSVSPTNQPWNPTDEQLEELVVKKVKAIKARRRHRLHQEFPNSTRDPCTATSTSSDKDATEQCVSCPITERCTKAAGHPLGEERSESSQTIAELMPVSNFEGHTSTPLNLSTGTSTSLKHSNQGSSSSPDKCASVILKLPVQMLRNGDKGNFFCSEDDEDNVFCGESFHSTCCDRYLVMNGRSSLHYSLKALKELIANLESLTTFTELDNFSEVMLQQFWDGKRSNIQFFASTEYPRLMMEVSATCTKNEEEAPHVLTAVLPGLKFCCSSSPNTKNFRSSTGMELECTDPEEGVPRKLSTKSGKGNITIKPVDVDHGQCMVERSSSKLYSPTDIIFQKSNQTKPSTCHQKSPDKNAAGNLQKATLEPGGTFSVTVVRDPQYEDISESEVEPQLDMKHQESYFSANLKGINDKENYDEMPILSPQLPQTNIEYSEYVHNNDQRELFSNLKPPNPEIKHMNGFTAVPFPNWEGERGLGAEADSLNSPSSTLEEQADDEVDDWFVIPLLVCDIKMEEENDGSVNQEEVLSEDEWKEDGSDGAGEQNSPSLNSGVASLPKQELSERDVRFIQTHSENPTNDLEIQKEWSGTNIEAITPQDVEDPDCESDDSCATEDSCDYTAGPERNYLTVSRQVWQNRTLPVSQNHNNPKYAQENKSQRSVFHKNVRDMIKTSDKAMLEGCKDVIEPIQKHKISPSDSAEGGLSPHVSQKRKYEETIEANIPRSKFVPQGTQFKEMAPAESSKYQPIKKTQLIETKSDLQKTNKQLSPNQHPKSHESQKYTSVNIKPQTQKIVVSTESSDTEDSEDGFSDPPSSPYKLKKILKRVEVKVKSVHDQPNTHMASKVTEESDGLLQNVSIKRMSKMAHLSDSSETDNSNHTNSNDLDRLSATIKLKNGSASSENFQQKQPKSADSGTSSVSPPRIIKRLYVQKSASSNCLKLFHKSQVHSQVGDKTLGTPKAPTANSRRTDCTRTSNSEKGVSKPKSSNDHYHNTKKMCVSTPSLSGPKPHSSSFTPQGSEADSQPSTADLSSMSTRDCSASKATPSSAWNKVIGLWKNDYFPISKQRLSSLGTEENSVTKNNLHPTREPVPGTSSSGKLHRRRKSSKKSETPLMKRTKSEAKERTRDIKCNAPKPQRFCRDKVFIFSGLDERD